MLFNVTRYLICMKDYNELVTKLQEIKDMGWVKTHRRGNTGIGKTLEDLLGITENNVPGPNALGVIELKSARKGQKSMLTLFTKSPNPPKANSVLLNRYGYETSTSGGKKVLHTTVRATCYNTLRGQQGFKIDVKDDKLILADRNNGELGRWEKNILKDRFERKLPKLLYVKADCKGRGEDEEFWFNEALGLSGFSFENFIQLVKEGVIYVDVRIGQCPDGRPHDHGTGFRVQQDKLDMCFSKRIKVI